MHLVVTLLLETAHNLNSKLTICATNCISIKLLNFFMDIALTCVKEFFAQTKINN